MDRRFFALLVLLLAALACAWSDLVAPAAPVIEPSPLPTFGISTLTPLPTETPPPSPTSTPDAPIAWPKDLGVNCRYGPGKEWEAVSSLNAETITEIEGRTINTAWWYVSDPVNPGEYCWVAYDVVDTAGNLNIVPIVDPPTAEVTAVTVDAPVKFVGCGASNQVTFLGALTANGPTTVIYHWEVSGDEQQTTADETIEFVEAGTQKITMDQFSADCGEYFVRLLITSPNELSAEITFKIQAP
jgi:hypothetical protein